MRPNPSHLRPRPRRLPSLAATLSLLLCAALCLPPAPAGADPRPLPAPLSSDSGPRLVFDVAVESREELLDMLRRAETLSEGYDSRDVEAIALVLHGPELRYFDLRQLGANREVIELAGRLDARRVIEIMACEAMLDSLEIPAEHLPGYIDLVPYGPDEVDRLRGQGYKSI